jgi:hypothetical protein
MRGSVEFITDASASDVLAQLLGMHKGCAKWAACDAGCEVTRVCTEIGVKIFAADDPVRIEGVFEAASGDPTRSEK